MTPSIAVIRRQSRILKKIVTEHLLLKAIAAATFEGVDSTPLEGFNPEAVAEILGLNEKGLRSCVMLPLGYREADKDWLVDLEKVRKPKDKLITVIDKNKQPIITIKAT